MSYNTFAGEIPKDSVYVYGLTDNNNVFYIGITSYITFRYKQHFSEHLCSNYIANMKIKGHYPGIMIFGAFTVFGQAEAAEHSLIRAFYLMGHKLCNYHQNPKDNIIKRIPIDSNIKLNRMPQNLHKQIISEAIEHYKQFRSWQPLPVKERI